MQLVTFARAVTPYNKGDKRLVTDGVAMALLEAGDICESEDWPPALDTKGPEKPKRPTINIKRPAGITDRRATR